MNVSRHRERPSDAPPVAGMPDEVWTWLRESQSVRPDAVAGARARLDAGEHPSAAQVAEALLRTAICVPI